MSHQGDRLPLVQAAELPDFDFTVPGVTSLSVDLHKYGYAAKGASVILYRNKDLRKYQILACTDTTAYTLINPTVLSSKSGGPMAGAWAIFNYLGDEGYMRMIRTVQEATRRLTDGINAIPGLRVLGQPDMCMFSFTSDSINAYQLADVMHKRSWYLQGQFSTPQTPRSLHVSVSFGNAHSLEPMLKDLRECMAIVQAKPMDTQAIRAMVQPFLASPSPEAFQGLARMAGIAGQKLPEEMAVINEVLDALPDEMANTVLIDYFNDLYV